MGFALFPFRLAEKKISILLADDHALVRGMLARFLQGAPDMELAGEAGTAAEALEMARRLAPDIVLLDVEMPGAGSFDAARTIHRELPRTRVIFLSAHHHDVHIEQALAARASGYLTKNEPPESVLAAIREVHGGGMHFSPEVLGRIVIEPGGPRLSPAAGPASRWNLSPRELEVLRLLAQGKSKKEIGGMLHLSLNTINRHAASVMKKLGIHDRVELARFAIREGIVEA